MNAAEITDKLGLHSLRQRAWVCPPQPLLHLFPLSRCYAHTLDEPEADHVPRHSTSSLPAPRLVTVCTRVSSGSPPPSARPVTSKESREAWIHSAFSCLLHLVTYAIRIGLAQLVGSVVICKIIGQPPIELSPLIVFASGCRPLWRSFLVPSVVVLVLS